jgi:hypothetical protein
LAKPELSSFAKSINMDEEEQLFMKEKSGLIFIEY